MSITKIVGMAENEVKALSDRMNATWDRWAIAVSEARPEKRCSGCSGEMPLLADASIARSRSQGRLALIYSACLGCEPSEAMWQRMGNCGFIAQRLAARLVEEAWQPPSPSRAYAHNLPALVVGFCSAWPNGRHVELGAWEHFESIQPGTIERIIAGQEPVLLQVRASCAGDSLPKWLARAAPLWIVDRPKLLRSLCEHWPTPTTR